MSLEIKVPTVGESITEVTIAQWFKKEGEMVAMDEVICELESDKATFELNAEAAGKLHIVAKEGDTIEIGAVICEIDADASGATVEKPAEAPKAAKAEAPKPTGKVKEMIVPTVGESITEVTISNWLKKTGDYVTLDEIIAEVDSDKATFELPAEASGILTVVAQEGDTIEIGALICKIEVTEGGVPTQAAPTSDNSGKAESAPSSQDKTYATGHASPAAAKILAEKGIDPKSVKGTGVDGRITKEDADSAQKSTPAPKPAESKKEDSAPITSTPGSRNESRERMSSLRKTVAKRLVSVKNETAMLTTFNEVDMSAIFALRKEYKDAFAAKHGVGLGFMSFFTLAVIRALKMFPAVNSMIDEKDMITYDFCDISIAVSGPKGLMVPVIRNAELLSFRGVEAEVKRLAVRAREGAITVDEMTGGTFTITNGGVFGSMLSTPIINPPQSAILGMHNIVERPVVKDGAIVAAPVMYVALSYDHRIIDGRESVGFLVAVKEALENPVEVLMNNQVKQALEL